jgi:competence protein ComEA
MNERTFSTPERGLILLIAAALLASGVILYATRERPTSVSVWRGEPIVVEDALVVRPTFLDSRKVDLNTATIEELVRLSGIGEVLAGRIVAHREAHGWFSSIDELTDVSGIGPATVEAIRDRVTIGSEEAPASDDQ